MKTRSNNIVFLYAEVTPYLMGCIKHFSSMYPQYNIIVFYLDVFSNIKIKKTKQYKFIPKTKFKSRNNLLDYVIKLNPAIILISGRMDNDYLFIAKKLKNKVLRVTLQDTMFQKTLKQLFQRIFSRFLYKRYFDKFWGVGSQQTKFAKSLGYKTNNIHKGFYVADKIFFNNHVKIVIKENLQFLFIGRLVKEKNILILANAIETINNQRSTKHKLIVIGEGYQYNNLKKINCVELMGLKTQEEIISIAKKCNAFCLPSIYEPWGVVLHEMAALGLPILSSNKCGSSHDLVEDGYNGFKFNPYSFESIQESLIKFIDLSIDKKKQFGFNSNKLAKELNHENWNKTLISLLN